MNRKDSGGGNFLGGIGLHLLCCGIPILFIVVGTAGVSSFFALLFKQWWIIIIGLVVLSSLFIINRKRK